MRGKYSRTFIRLVLAGLLIAVPLVSLSSTTVQAQRRIAKTV